MSEDPSSLAWAYRLVHLRNLEIYLRRQRLHAPNFWPDDGLEWTPIHDSRVQTRRSRLSVPCGPGGSLLDYVPFYFGTRGPMLLRVHTDRVSEVSVDQHDLVYLVVKIERLVASGLGLVFTDGNAAARMTEFYGDAQDLDKLDSRVIGARHWADSTEDPDRQRRKQAELLVHRELPLELVRGIAVYDESTLARVVQLGDELCSGDLPEVVVRRNWYY